MARAIKVEDIGRYVEQRMEQLLRVAVLDADTRLKMESPVDTGRFRASWQVGENSAGVYDAGPQQEATGAFKDQSSPPSSPTPPALRRMNYGKETIGNVYSVHNNLPYAERLATASTKGGRAWSKQAAPGWVQMVAKDLQAYIVVQAAKIGRES